jgi:hypothetical protein
MTDTCLVCASASPTAGLHSLSESQYSRRSPGISSTSSPDGYGSDVCSVTSPVDEVNDTLNRSVSTTQILRLQDGIKTLERAVIRLVDVAEKVEDTAEVVSRLKQRKEEKERLRSELHLLESTRELIEVPTHIVEETLAETRVPPPNRTLGAQRTLLRSGDPTPSPFRETIAEKLRTSLQELAANEAWARKDPRAAELATVAQKFDNLVIHRYYRLPELGMLIRMLDAQIAVTGESPSLSSARETAKATFDARSSALEAELDYTVVPIQKLVRVQLGNALLAADYAAGR